MILMRSKPTTKRGLTIISKILKNPAIKMNTLSSRKSMVYNNDLLFFCMKHRFSSIGSNISTKISNSNVEVEKNLDVVARQIDFDTASRIEGEESQIVIVDIEAGQILRAESGSMIYMTEGIEMSTSAGSTGNAFTKWMVGQNLFYSDFTYDGTSSSSSSLNNNNNKGQVALGTDFPSKIKRFSIDDNNSLIAQKGSLLCYSHSINIQMEFVKKISAGFFGGEGFVLMKLEGHGDVFLKGGGKLVKHELHENEVLRISSGCLVAFTQTVQYDISMMPGIKNIMFGGEGLFITTLTGPGTVWLQSQPSDRFIAEIARRIPSSSGIGLGIPIIGGGMSGGADNTTSDDDEEEEDNTTTSEEDSSDAVAATDASIEADRNATIASSGLSSSSSSSSSDDPDSPSALFGDAAPQEMQNDDAFPFNKDSSSSFPDDDDDSGSSFDDSTSFSNQDNFDYSDDNFDDGFKDETTFSTSKDNSESPSSDNDSGSFLSSLWDFFSDDDE